MSSVYVSKFTKLYSFGGPTPHCCPNREKYGVEITPYSSPNFLPSVVGYVSPCGLKDSKFDICIKQYVRLSCK